MAEPDLDTDKLDDAALAILSLTLHGGNRGLAPVSPDTQAVAVWAAMNSRGERIFSPECGWLSL